jgi:hypothetical protein
VPSNAEAANTAQGASNTATAPIFMSFMSCSLSSALRCHINGNSLVLPFRGNTLQCTKDPHYPMLRRGARTQRSTFNIQLSCRRQDLRACSAGPTQTTRQDRRMER